MSVKAVKHKETGIGILFSLLQIFAFFYIWPRYVALIWPYLLDFKQKNEIKDFVFVMTVLQLQSWTILVVGNAFYSILYKGKFEFFEGYKSL